MKEKLRKQLGLSLLILFAVLGLSAGSIGAYFSLFPSSDASSSGANSTSQEPVVDYLMDGSLLKHCYFGYRNLNSAAAVGTKKNLSFTLTPSNVSDKNIIVSTSDSSKVSISTSTTQSGVPVVLCLMSAFTDTVTIKAYSEAMPNISCNVSVNVIELDSNYTKDLTFVWNNGSYQIGNGDSSKPYAGSETNVVIPKYYDDGQHGAAAVTTIASNAFYASKLVSVSIPSSVVSIGGSAFSGCSSLTSIAIPSSVTSIGGCAFGGCVGLASISVDSSNGAYSSADGVLFNKDKSVLVTYPAGKASSSYSIPSSVTSIGSLAFYSCTSLASVNIPSSVANIVDYAFSGCSSLTSIAIPSSVTSIGIGSFSECSSLTSIAIPSSVASIGGSAFYDCSSLTSIAIPSSVASIGRSAFSFCKELASISVDPSNGAYSSADGVLFNKDKSVLIAYPGGKTDSSYSIPDSVKNISNWGFCASQFTSVTFSRLMTSIDDGAFYSCSLTSLAIPNTITSIGNQAFLANTSLSSLTLPETMKSIGQEAFWCCNVPSIRIPLATTSIGYHAFYADYNYKCTIYCQRAESAKPVGWVTGWDEGVSSVVWG